MFTLWSHFQGAMDGDLAWTIGDILQHRQEWWVPGKIVMARQRLAEYWKVWVCGWCGEVWEASGWGIPGKIAATRQVWHILPPPPAPPPTIQCQAPPPLLSPLHFVQRPGASRDFLLLDIALDDWFRTLVERIELAKLGRDDLLQV